MKTLLSVLTILSLTTIAVAVDAGRLDAIVFLAAPAVAGLFAFALNDCWGCRRTRTDSSAEESGATSGAVAAQKVCVLCGGASSL